MEENATFRKATPMSKTNSARIEDYFQDLTDSRRGEVTYPLINIVVIAVCAVICGADDFVAIARFGNTKRDWLAKFLDLSTGVPSHDRFNAIFAALNPVEFQQCLLSWITALHGLTDGQIIAIDGKTLRRSFDASSSKAAIHMVSAWATTNQISLGQVVVDAKSNEITAIPKLLELIEISGSLVKIDAIGCQTEIAKQIIEAGADYCLAAKANQPTLFQEIDWHFVTHMENDFADSPVRQFETSEKGHGRIEMRYYYICPIPDGFSSASRWPGLKAIGAAISNTERDGKMTCEVRYYILSNYLSARRFADAVRGHWGIENSLHWQLDVTFNEDQSRVRLGHADANFSILRRTALGILKKEETAKVGIKNKRLQAAWDDQYLEKLVSAA